MMRIIMSLGLFLLLFPALVSLAAAEEWTTYKAKEYNVQFDLPGDWETAAEEEDGIPYLESASPDESSYLLVYIYKSKDTSPEELLEETVEELHAKLKGEIRKEKVHGLDALVVDATGEIEKEKVGMLLMATSYKNVNYVAYVFTELAEFTKNEAVLNKILDSFRPIE